MGFHSVVGSTGRPVHGDSKRSDLSQPERPYVVHELNESLVDLDRLLSEFFKYRGDLPRREQRKRCERQESPADRTPNFYRLREIDVRPAGVFRESLRKVEPAPVYSRLGKFGGHRFPHCSIIVPHVSRNSHTGQFLFNPPQDLHVRLLPLAVHEDTCDVTNLKNTAER